MVFKGVLFVLVGTGSGSLLVVGIDPPWQRLVLVCVTIWAFCRAYYFAFYVLERYVDPGYRFSGVLSALRYLARTRPGGRQRPEEPTGDDSTR